MSGLAPPPLYQTQTVARGLRPPGRGLLLANSGTSYPTLMSCHSGEPQTLRRWHLKVSVAAWRGTARDTLGAQSVLADTGSEELTQPVARQSGVAFCWSASFP